MGESACSPYTCQMLSMVGSLGESRVLLPPQPQVPDRGRAPQASKMSFVPFFMTPFRTLQPEGENRHRQGCSCLFGGKLPQNPPNFGLFGGFLRGSPKPPNFFGIAPKNGFSEGAIFPGYGTVQPEKVLRRCRKPVAVHKTCQQAAADSIHKDSIRWSGLQVQRIPKPESPKKQGDQQKGAPP